MSPSIRRAFDLTTSMAASVFRLGAGLYGGHGGPRPEQPLELYDFEACPYCRRVREALTALDLSALIYPCPKGGIYRQRVRDLGGREMFPFLVDPNQDVELYESVDIVAHLYEHYGTGTPPVIGQSGLSMASSSLASIARPTRGRNLVPGHQPENRLELYSFEASPYCRLVREVLCELELPYLLHNVGKRSPARPDFIDRSGKMMVPYLIDPNTDTAMFESADIIRYLRSTYAE